MQKCLRIVWAAVFGVVIPGSVYGQTLFNSPDTFPNYSAYQYIDECVAAAARITSEADAKSSVWRDTLPLEDRERMSDVPVNAIRAAQACLVRVSVDTLSLDNTHIWASALLMAQRDHDVEKLYRRFFDSPVRRSPEEFVKMLNVYRTSRPIRLEGVERLYQFALANVSPDSVVRQVAFRLIKADMARKARNKEMKNALLREVLSITDTLSDSVKSSDAYRLVGLFLYESVRDFTEQEGLDSLSISLSAYQSYLGGIWSRVMVGPFPHNMFMNNPVGLEVPPLEGDFWYRSVKATQSVSAVERYRKIEPYSRPVKGKINLIAFLQGGCHASSFMIRGGRNNGNMSCWRIFSAIHRMKNVFPDLEVTVVSKTYGSVGDAPPVGPSEEADTLAKYFLGYHRLPATLVVSKTEFFRLAGLDQRRIDSKTANESNYTLNNISYATPGSILLVDEAGRIVSQWNINRDEESTIRRIIAAVFSRLARER